MSRARKFVVSILVLASGVAALYSFAFFDEASTAREWADRSEMSARVIDEVFPGSDMPTAHSDWANSSGQTGQVLAGLAAALGAIALTVGLTGRSKRPRLGNPVHRGRASRGPDDILTSLPQGSVTDELAKLADLRDRGALSDGEFEIQKRRLLDPDTH